MAEQKELADRKLSSLELHEGTTYRLFIDKSVSNGLNGINLGIRKMMKGTEVIYKENMQAHKVIWSSFYSFRDNLFGNILSDWKKKI